MRLPRNKVYYIYIDKIRGAYQSYIDVFIQPNNVNLTPQITTFKEDLTVIIKYMNGVLNDDEFKEYIIRTTEEYDTSNERENMMYDLTNVITSFIIDFIPEYNVFPLENVYLVIERDKLFVVDMRRSIYVPESLSLTITQRERKDVSSRYTGEIYTDDNELWV